MYVCAGVGGVWARVYVGRYSVHVHLFVLCVHVSVWRRHMAVTIMTDPFLISKLLSSTRRPKTNQHVQMTCRHVSMLMDDIFQPLSPECMHIVSQFPHTQQT